MYQINEILQTHDNLDDVIRDPKGRIFVSEWNCLNPFSSEYLQNITNMHIPPHREAEYVYFKDDYYLSSLISKFHVLSGERLVQHEEIMVGAGSTPLIASFCLWMKKHDLKDFLYLPPLYYTFYYFSELFGIHPRPISSKQAFEDTVSIRLPNKRSVLVICDPIWYVGAKLRNDLIEEISEWQAKTGSTIFVDGSFQYTAWDLSHAERTNIFDPDLTFRLVCPTKALAIHGYRFSYLLLPRTEKPTFIYLHDNLTGATPLRNLIFAQQAMMTMTSDQSNNKIISHVASLFQKLKSTGSIEPIVTPDCGYFIFAKPTRPTVNHIAMGQTYFDLSGYPDFIRINLLAPNLHEVFG